MSRRKKNRLEKLSDSQETDASFSEPVVVPIEDSIDLHAFHPKDIPSVVEEYLDQCRQVGLTEVRIIHGRGTGVQRNIVRSILQKHSRVLSFQDAPAEAGGWGATVVVLKNES
jgi:dsDNA-specific endonuclease/ATPase MutS2